MNDSLQQHACPPHTSNYARTNAYTHTLTKWRAKRHNHSKFSYTHMKNATKQMSFHSLIDRWPPIHYHKYQTKTWICKYTLLTKKLWQTMNELYFYRMFLEFWMKPVNMIKQIPVFSKHAYVHVWTNYNQIGGKRNAKWQWELIQPSRLMSHLNRLHNNNNWNQFIWTRLF